MMAHISATTIASQEKAKLKSGNPAPQKVKYRIAKSYRTVTSQSKEYQIPPTLVIFISIGSSNFNERDMTTLGKQLNNDFSFEPRLTVFIFSSYNDAKRFTPSEESSDYAKSWRAFRGSYHLDRDKGEEDINFSTDPGTPQIRRTLILRGKSASAEYWTASSPFW
jgi:hypothetical protein